MNEKKLALNTCKILILDECDKMLEIGNKLNHEDVKYFVAQEKEAIIIIYYDLYCINNYTNYFV